MHRNEITDAIILKANRMAEINKGLTLLTNNGLLDCIAYGALKEKSKLRSATQIFSHATFYLYFNPVKKSYKVTDIANKALFENIGGSVSKCYTACLWTEVIIKSYASAENAAYLFKLMLNSLTLLNTCTEKDESYLNVQFLWRFLHCSGFKPEINTCNECGQPIAAQDSLFFEAYESHFLCGKCTLQQQILINPGIRIYLTKTLELGLEKALAIKIAKSAIETLKKITYQILEVRLDLKLNTLKSGHGII